MTASGGREDDLLRLADLASEFELEHLALTTRLIADRVSEGRFYVACIGQFKRGKSTLLNALVGQAILPTGVIPVTTIPTILRYGPSLVARIRLPGSGWNQIPANDIEEYISGSKNPGNRKGVEALEILIPCPLLASGMCLVDTPGLGSVFASHTQATGDFVPQMDVALFVLGADPPISGDELALAESVARQTREILFVLNKADRTSEADRSTSAEFARQVLEARLGRTFPGIFEISALERLERRGPERDWPRLQQTLEQLVQRSGNDLVREACLRAVRHASAHLLAAIKENRDALQRPIEESEVRIQKLRQIVERSGEALQDLGALLGAEQDRLSRLLNDRRNHFLEQTRGAARAELRTRFPLAGDRRNGPVYRREIMHQAQEIARARLVPWLEAEEGNAQEAFRGAMRRFAEMGSEFLRRLSDTMFLSAADFSSEFDPEPSLRSKSHFHFHVIERIAAPASPLRFAADVVCGVLGMRSGIEDQAAEFLDQLIEINSARVQSDFDERVRMSRKTLETEIRAVLRDVLRTAERTLAHARTAQVSGTSAVQGALARLDQVEREIRTLAGSQDGTGKPRADPSDHERKNR